MTDDSATHPWDPQTPMLVLACVACAACLVCAGCGDDGTSGDGGVADADTAVPDTGADAAIDSGPPGNVYWIDDDGDDTADGSEAAPWGSFSHAIAQLTPGDTLIVEEGSRFSSFRFDCENNSCLDEPCPSGEPGRPITVRAETPRTVRFENGLDDAFTIRGCSYVTVEGFELSQQEAQPTYAFTSIGNVVSSDHVVLRDMVVHSINRWTNGHMFSVNQSRWVLLEDMEFYDFHRGAMMFYQSEHVTARRLYVNSRDRPNLEDPEAYQCCCEEGGDYGIWLNGNFDVTIENSIVERTCESFVITADYDTLGDRAGTGNRMLGNIALDSYTYGFDARSDCEDADPCPEANVNRDSEFVHCASVGAAGVGFRANAAVDAVLRNVTSIDAAGQDFRFEVRSWNVGVTGSSLLLVNGLDDGAGDVGYRITEDFAAEILSSNSFGNGTDFEPAYPVEGHGVVDPSRGECTVYAPEGSPMRGAGLGGEDIGARIVNRYVDGVLTDQPLWDPSTGAFPCGAIIPGGINDEAVHPGGTCRTVHERLSIGSAACPLP